MSRPKTIFFIYFSMRTDERTKIKLSLARIIFISYLCSLKMENLAANTGLVLEGGGMRGVFTTLALARASMRS